MEKAQNTQCFACPGANAPFMLIIDATSVKGKKTVAATVNASKLLPFAIPTRLSSTEMRAVRRFSDALRISPEKISDEFEIHFESVDRICHGLGFIRSRRLVLELPTMHATSA